MVRLCGVRKHANQKKGGKKPTQNRGHVFWLQSKYFLSTLHIVQESGYLIIFNPLTENPVKKIL